MKGLLKSLFDLKVVEEVGKVVKLEKEEKVKMDEVVRGLRLVLQRSVFEGSFREFSWYFWGNNFS